jgi:hypothetical protein
MVNQPMSSPDLDGWVVGNDGQDDSQNLGRPRTNADNSGAPKLPIEPWWTLTNIHGPFKRGLQNHWQGTNAKVGALASPIDQLTRGRCGTWAPSS